MALTETWIKPEDNATPAALSNNFSFSHTPCLSGRGVGTGLLISNNWKFTPLSSLSINSSFESQINFVVVYRPPGPLVNLVEELDLLLSTFLEDVTPLVILGDFNIHLDKPQAADFHTLLASFDLKRVLTTATHKSGNQLDLIYTLHCSTDHVLVTPLHTSDHFLLTLNLNMIPDTSHTPPHVTFRHNLRSLSPSRLSAMVSSLLPLLKQLSSLDANSATDTFCSTLISCFDTFYPLTSRPARTTPSAPWLSVVLYEHLSKYLIYIDHSDFSANVSTAKRTYYHDKINNSPNSRMLFKIFSSLLCPPPPPPSSTLTADDFATFFINKITNLTAQFSTPQSVKHILPASIKSFTYFSPLSETEVSKLILSSHLTTCPLDPIPSHLLQAISPAVVPALTHIFNTSLHTGFFPSAFKQAHITPLLKKLNLAKTELLVISANPSFHHNFTFQLCSSNITPSKTARNLGVMIDDKLKFSDHFTKTARSFRFALYNIKKIRSFLSEHAKQLHVQALVLSRLDYCNALLAGLPASSIKPLQLFQNASARLIFNEPKRTHLTSICAGYQ